MQFVFAGKAHPADTPGKELIQRIEQFARQADVRNRFVFLADYDISIARAMYHGCDVWLNTPRRPLEACGTSGMKAALNGALNCSILDGWWDECYDGTNGWAIESAEDDPDHDRRDLREADSLFSILEQQVTRKFYDRDATACHVTGSTWCARPGPRSARVSRRHAWCATTRPRCTSRRRHRHNGGWPIDAKAAVELAAWRRAGHRGVGRRRGHAQSRSTTSDVPAGTRRLVNVEVELGGLSTERRTGRGGARTARPRRRVPRATVRRLSSSRAIRRRAPTPARSSIGLPGAYGVTARVFPVHPDLANTFDLGLVAWAN